MGHPVFNDIILFNIGEVAVSITQLFVNLRDLKKSNYIVLLMPHWFKVYILTYLDILF